MILLLGCPGTPLDSELETGKPPDSETTAETADTVDTVDTGPRPYTVTVFTDGLPAGTYSGLSVAPDGALWAASTLGLVWLEPSSGATRLYTTADYLQDDAPLSVLAASDGTIWVGHAGDETRQGEQMEPQADGSLAMVKPIDFTASDEETTILRLREQPYGDGAGDIWMGANEGALVYDVSAGAFYEHAHPQHPHGNTTGLAFSDDDNEWNLDEYQLSRWDYANDGNLSSSLQEFWTVWPVEVEETIAGTDADFGDGVLWVTSSLFGVAAITVGAEVGTSTTELYAEPASANAVRVDSRGLVWVGSDEGLWIWDGAALLPVADGAIPAGAVDELAVGDGEVWVAIGATLVRITGDPRTP